MFSCEPVVPVAEAGDPNAPLITVPARSRRRRRRQVHSPVSRNGRIGAGLDVRRKLARRDAQLLRDLLLETRPVRGEVQRVLRVGERVSPDRRQIVVVRTKPNRTVTTVRPNGSAQLRGVRLVRARPGLLSRLESQPSANLRVLIPMVDVSSPTQDSISECTGPRVNVHALARSHRPLLFESTIPRCCCVRSDWRCR